MSETKITLKNKEERVIELTDFSDVNLCLESNSKLVLKLANFRDNSDIKISGKIKKDAYLSVIFADFSKGTSKVLSKIDLTEEGSTADWTLATLANKKDNKVFDCSFIHEVGKTTSNMSNLTGIVFGPRGEGNNINEIMFDARTKGFSEFIKRRFILGSYILLRENQERLFKNAQRLRHLIVN